MPLEFPADRQAYPCQTQMIELMLRGIELGENVLISCPTGSGKSLALLLAAHNCGFEVLVGTRTHSQVTQLLRVLKTMPGFDSAMAVLGSRDQTCVNREIEHTKGFARNCACSAIKRECGFFLGGEQGRIVTMNIFDLEDLVGSGRSQGICPYFESRKQLADARMVFAPYNYIIDEVVRDSTKIRLDNRVVILDEGHNLDNVARDSASLSALKVELSRASGKFALYAPNVSKLLGFLAALDFAVPVAPSTIVWRDDWLAAAPGELQALYDGKNPATGEFLGRTQASELPMDVASRMVFVLKLVKESPKAFRVWTTTHVEICCLDASVPVQRLASKVRCLILVSGTLSPPRGVASELGLEFKHVLDSAGVIDAQKNVFCRLVPEYCGAVMSSRFNNANKRAYVEAVGQLVLDVCRATPNGVLVFFTSYAALNAAIDSWSALGLAGQIAKLKHVFKEGTSTDEITAYKAASSRGGALFLGVYRGKASEGLDFTDAQARAVILVGIPFPSLTDTKVDEKKRYNDRNKCKLTGDAWYTREAYIAINQALGRVVRHKDDYGCVFLVDERFGEEQNIARLAKWIRAVVRLPGPALMSDVAEFFRARAA